VAVHPFGANLASVPDGNELRDAMGRRGVGRCRLLFVGVDEYRKGADVAVAVARQLRARGVEVDLQIVGGDVPGEDHDLVRRYGFLSRKDAMQGTRLAQLFLQADFFLLPARADCTPIVLSEAAASGLPVATTKVGGIGEIVRAGTWGIALAPEASPADYADWIKQTYSDRGAYERMAKAARLDYEERLNWDSFCRRLTAIVDEIRRAAPREAGQREPVEAAHKVAAATV
jgi:glycosyltransferase involved in cell wall biosynthesis